MVRSRSKKSSKLPRPPCILMSIGEARDAASAPARSHLSQASAFPGPRWVRASPWNIPFSSNAWRGSKIQVQSTEHNAQPQGGGWEHYHFYFVMEAIAVPKCSDRIGGLQGIGAEYSGAPETWL